jgi:uncharacterized membrane protein
MAYLILKIIHIISAAFLVGSLFVGVSYAFCFRKIQELCVAQPLLRKILKWHLIFGLQALLVTPVSAMAIIEIQHYDPSTTWVIGSLVVFLLVSSLWLLTVLNLYRSTLAPDAFNFSPLKNAARIQGFLLTLNIPCIVLLCYFMTIKPS